MSASNYTKCSHCDTILNPIDDQPCHNCGETGRRMDVVVEDRVDVEDHYDIQRTSGKTNRSTIHANSRNPTDTVQLERLIINYVENGVDDLASYIDSLVKDFNSLLYLENTTFFRGVDTSVKLSSHKIGPPPNSSDGRYNVRDEPCLYLIDNIDFLFVELNSSSIRVQKYNIPVNAFKIADLSPNNNTLNNSLALAFDMTESGGTSSGYCFEKELQQRGKSRYLVSQLLSSLFKKYGWDGLYIPGVHGGQGGYYHNLVIFSTIVDKWEDWAIDSHFAKK